MKKLNQKKTNFVKTFEQFKNDMIEDMMVTGVDISYKTDITNKLDKFLEENMYYSNWSENDLQDKSQFLTDLSNKLKDDSFTTGLWLYKRCNIDPDMQLLMFLESLK